MFHQPLTLDAALSLKAELGDSGTVVAGGTDLIVGIRKGSRKVNHFIDLSRVDDLRGIQEANGWLTMGALTTHAELEGLEVTALAEAAATVGGPQIRNLGTVGGQLGTASPAGDVSCALIGLNAELELTSAARGTRRMPVAEFFVGPGRTVLAEDELITRIFVPTDRKSAFYKIGKRDAVAISLVMAAVSIGDAGDVAIGVGCVAPVPLRCPRAEAALSGKSSDPEAITKAAELVMEEVSPISDHRGSADYRRVMAGTLTKRLVTRIASQG